jgi:tripartite-type tricarboxylate transporter receptor subunit TctC
MRATTFLIGLAVLLAACSAPAPSPTAAKPTEPAKPAGAAPSPAASPGAAKPAASPAASPVASPVASPAASASSGASATPARQFNEAAVADFYRGKTLTVVVSSTAGGGYDLYGRALARHIGRFVPGNPTVIVQNVPGGGGIVAANNVFSGSQDGTFIGGFSRGLPAEELFGMEGVRFKANEFKWLGSMNDEVSVCALRTDAPVKKFEDLYTTEAIVGGSGADTDYFPQVLNALLGTRFRLAQGYPGGNEINLGVERGEVQGRCGWSYSSVVSTRADWFKEPAFMRLLVQMALKKHADIQDVPLVVDMAKTEEQRSLLRVVFSRQTMGRPFALPPQTPADRVAALRTAFDKMMRDPEFLAEAERTKLEVNSPASGEEVQEIVSEVMRTPADQAKKLADIQVQSGS